MNLDQTHELLQLIADFDGRKLTETMADSWLTLLGDVDFADAEAAVMAHYANQNAVRMLPGDVKVKAAGYAEARARVVEQVAARALPSGLTGPPKLTPEGERARAEFRRLAARFGNLDRRPAHTRPDPSSPTSPTSEITAEAKDAALRAARRLVNAA